MGPPDESAAAGAVGLVRNILPVAKPWGGGSAKR